MNLRHVSQGGGRGASMYLMHHGRHGFNTRSESQLNLALEKSISGC